MKHHHIIAILTVSIFFVIPLNISGRKRRQILKNRPSHASVIIFDITGVLFKENQKAFAQKIGYGKLASYALTHWKNPSYTCLDMLDTMSCDPIHKPVTEIKLKGRILPQCIVDLHLGTKMCVQVRQEIDQYIEQLDEQGYFASASEKSITREIIGLILDPEQLPDLTKPVIPIIKLAQQLKNAGYQLYLVANLPDELFKVMNTSYPEIIALFDGMVISSHVKMVKPDNQIFTHLLQTYQLDPNKCILIDDQKDSIAAAEQLGITGIVCNKPPVVVRKLKQLGIRL